MQQYKILKVCTSRSWGGMEIHMTRTCDKLRQHGHFIFPVCFPESPIFHQLKRMGFEPFTLNLKNYFQPIQILKLRKFVQKNEIELIQADYSRDLWTIVPALAFSRKIPLVLIKHIGTMKAKRDFLHRWIYRQVDYIISISKVIQENIIATHPISPEKVGIIYHGVDFDKFRFDLTIRESTRQMLGIGKEEILIGIIGRLQRAKGYFEFLEMAAALSKRFSHIRFVIIGEASKGEESEADQIKLKIDELQLNDKLILTGYREDVPALLSAMDIFVFPSHAEAFGLVLIEAMAMKLPVVTANCDGVLDIVLENRTGELVPPKEVTGLIQAVEKLILDRKLRQIYSENGYNRARDCFSEARMLDQLEGLYHRLIQDALINQGE